MNTVRVTRRLRSLAAVGACFTLATLLGCGGDSTKASLKGKVTHNGAPVTGGTITLHPASGAPFPITIKADGSFEVGDAPIGPMKVTIETDSVSTVAPGYGPPAGMPLPKDTKPPELPKQDTTKQPTKVVISAKYKSADTSGLTWDTKTEKNKTFDLPD
jgi:hypothetical protein